MLLNEYYVRGDENRQIPMHLNFGKYMLDRLRKKGDEIALVNSTTGEELTYRSLTQYSVNLGQALINLGIGKGDVVAMGSEKRINFMPTVLSIVFTGATYTPFDLYSGYAVLKHKLSITKPKYFILSKLFWERYGDILKTFPSIQTYIMIDDDPDWTVTVKSLISRDIDVKMFEPAKVVGQTDPAFILYSSGTTGPPKGVRLSHVNCILNSLPDDFKDETLQTAFVFGEWYHNYDTFMTYKFLAAGKKTVFINAVNAVNFLESVHKYQINLAILMPYLINLILKEKDLEKYNLDSLKIIYSRASLLHSKTIEKVKQRLPKLQNVLQGYGMTECGELSSENWGVRGAKPGSVGMVTPGLTMKVLDLKTGELLGPNKPGEFRVSGPLFMKDYIGVDPSTYLDEEGFFITGDLGYYDEEKYFYIIDRIKEVIDYAGDKVAPIEIETILELHPKVLEAGVVGKPDPVYGELPTAFVVKQPDSDATESELVDYIAAQVPPYMRLWGGVQFIEKIPRSPRGKILRRQLREMLN